MKFQYIQKNSYRYINRSQRKQKSVNVQEDTDNTLNKLKHAHTPQVNEIRKLIQDMKIEFNIDWRKHNWDDPGNEKSSKSSIRMALQRTGYKGLSTR